MSAEHGFGKGEIRSLTGLRGCAAMIVMLYHFTLSIPGSTGPVAALLHKGYLCVDLFFVLSGFVMAYSQEASFAGHYKVRSHLRFLVARLARIYPLYALIAIESAAMLVWRTGILDSDAPFRTLLFNLTMVQAWGLAPSLEGAAWSISTEWAAYLMFPLLLAATVSAARHIAGITLALALLAVVYVSLAPDPVTLAGQSRMGPLDVYSSATALPLIRCVAEFSLGLGTFRLARFLVARRRARAWARWAVWITLAAIVAMIAQPGSDACVVTLLAILIVALSIQAEQPADASRPHVSPQAGLIARGLGSAVPYRLGLWSYSIYLIHDKFSHPAALLYAWLANRVPIPTGVAIPAMCLVVVLCGALTFNVVELPLRKLVMRTARRVRPAAPAPAPSPEPVEGGAGALG